MTAVYLGENQISNIQSLSNLTNLTAVYLEKNQISNIQSLSTLENLRTLKVQDNPLISQECPIQKKSVCRFSF